MDLSKKRAELAALEAAIAADLKRCDEQLAGWAAEKQKALNAQLVLSGRVAQLNELEQSDVPTPAALAAVPDSPAPESPTSQQG